MKRGEEEEGYKTLDVVLPELGFISGPLPLGQHGKPVPIRAQHVQAPSRRPLHTHVVLRRQPLLLLLVLVVVFSTTQKKKRCSHTRQSPWSGWHWAWHWHPGPCRGVPRDEVGGRAGGPGRRRRSLHTRWSRACGFPSSPSTILPMWLPCRSWIAWCWARLPR